MFLEPALDALLTRYPRDALALQVGHIADFYHGDRDNLRARIARAMPLWSPDVPGYGFVLGMSAFGHEECGDYARAEEAGRHAIELDPDDSWAHHAITHVMEMQARQAEGIAWMDARRDHWAQEDNAFAYHNGWHNAIFHLDLDHTAEVLAIYDQRVRPGDSPMQIELVDAVALLWRMYLRGIEVGDRWNAVARAYEAVDEGGFYAFNDMHAMMAYAATGRLKQADGVLAAMRKAASADTTNAWMTREVGLPICQAIAAFGRERYGEAVDLLMPVRYRAHAFGGSHAQRDIVHRTIQEAALRDGQHDLAYALACERTALKPHCPFSWQLRSVAFRRLESASNNGAILRRA